MNSLKKLNFMGRGVTSLYRARENIRRSLLKHGRGIIRVVIDTRDPVNGEETIVKSFVSRT